MPVAVEETTPIDANRSTRMPIGANLSRNGLRMPIIANPWRNQPRRMLIGANQPSNRSRRILIGANPLRNQPRMPIRANPPNGRIGGWEDLGRRNGREKKDRKRGNLSRGRRKNTGKEELVSGNGVRKSPMMLQSIGICSIHDDA